ncbi:hypothetical protein Dimus_016273 [Dionaea muscipula]
MLHASRKSLATITSCKTLNRRGSPMPMVAPRRKHGSTSAHQLAFDSLRQWSEIVTLRAERDKEALHANFSQERLERFVEELDHQRGEANGILARNVELSRLIVDYEMKLHERSESLIAAEEHSRRLITEASLKAIRSTEEVREVTLVLDPFLETGCITLLAGVKEKQLLEALSPRHCALSLIGFMLHV